MIPKLVDDNKRVLGRLVSVSLAIDKVGKQYIELMIMIQSHRGEIYTDFRETILVAVIPDHPVVDKLKLDKYITGGRDRPCVLTFADGEVETIEFLYTYIPNNESGVSNRGVS